MNLKSLLHLSMENDYNNFNTLERKFPHLNGS